jgi:hypothetical protein
VVELTFENLYPLAGLLVISVTIWGMAKKFTAMDITMSNNQKDAEKNFGLNAERIKKLQEELVEVKKDIREIYTIVLKLNQQVQDKFSK